jgi:negative regulator of sigma E activity
MNTEWADALSRLTDGEPADAELVAGALESPEMRQLLVDYVRLRTAVRGDGPDPSAAFYARMRGALEPRRPHSLARPTSFRVAAAFALAVLLTGLGVEGWRHWREDTPPRPARVLRFDASEWAAAVRSGS